MIEATSRPYGLWPEMWIGMSKGGQNQAAKTKPRKLRGIYFIDPEDGEIQETENARNKLEVPFEAAMTSKTETTRRARKPQEFVASGSTVPNKKTKYACIVEAHESTRKRFRFTLPRNLELVGFCVVATSCLVLVRLVFTRMFYACWAA